MKEEEIKARIKKMSIRARVALGIRCIELYADELNVLADPIIEELLRHLWEFTRSNELDKWHDRIVEYDPELVTEAIEKKLLNELKYRTEAAVARQYRLHKALPPTFNELITWVIDIGLSNLYGGTGKYSRPSYESTMQALAYYAKGNNELPDLSPFEKSRFEEAHGWGYGRERSFFIDDKITG